ncbi:hypothetical protein [Roseivirga pacifica]
MIFEGMPWPLVLPLAIAAMIYGIMRSKKEEEIFAKRQKKQLKSKRNG